MNPIDDVNHVPLPPSSLQPSDFLEFLEEMKELLKELGEEISQSKNLFHPSSFSGVSLAVNHQVKILSDIEKMRFEMESFLQQAAGESKQAFQELSKAHADLLRLESAPLPESPIKKSSPEAAYLASAGFCEKKAKEILCTLRGESKPTQVERSLSSPASVKQTSEVPPSRPFLRALPGSLALDTKVLDKTPAADLWQKVKPLLDHLIVVVETQENMSKPSQKLVDLVRSLVSSHASFEKLDISPLFKEPRAGRKLESSQISYGEKASSSSLPKSFSPVPSPLKAPTPPSLRVPSPFERLIESIQPPLENPQKTEPLAKPLHPTPTSAPFTPEKKIEKRKSSMKKKFKRFWSREDQEDPEDKNPS